MNPAQATATIATTTMTTETDGDVFFANKASESVAPSRTTGHEPFKPQDVAASSSQSVRKEEENISNYYYYNSHYGILTTTRPTLTSHFGALGFVGCSR